MKKIFLVAFASMCVGVACKSRTFDGDSQVKSGDSSTEKNFEDVSCAFFCPNVTKPASAIFSTQRVLCEKGEMKPFGDGFQLVASADGTVISRDMHDVAIPKCMRYKLAVVTEGLSHPQYPALTPLLNQAEVWEATYKRIMPYKVVLTKDTEWGVLKVNDEFYLVKKVAGIRSIDGVGVYQLAGGYPDKPETSDKVVLNLFRRQSGKLEMEAPKFDL